MDTPKNNVFIAIKEEGETPLECLIRLKEGGFLPNDKFTYAGRLDPMASGLMIFLRGEAILEKDKYLSLDKEYEVEVLFGISTDTGDVLGKIEKIQNNTNINDNRPRDFCTMDSGVMFDIKNIKNICDSLIGETEVPYPWFSSKTINGKALHEIFRAGEDSGSLSGDIDNNVADNASDGDGVLGDTDGGDDVIRPLTKLSIQNIEILDFYMLTPDLMLKNIEERIVKVKGDFRQEEILKKWQSVLGEQKHAQSNYKNIQDKMKLKGDADISFPILKIKVKCKSGSYMRTLAELLAEKLKTCGLAYSIKRTRVGEFNGF